MERAKDDLRFRGCKGALDLGSFELAKDDLRDLQVRPGHRHPSFRSSTETMTSWKNLMS